MKTISRPLGDLPVLATDRITYIRRGLINANNSLAWCIQQWKKELARSGVDDVALARLKSPMDVCLFVGGGEGMTLSELDMRVRAYAIKWRGSKSVGNGKKSDGLVAPDILRWHGQESNVEAKAWKVLEVLWSGKPMEEEAMTEEVWGEGGA